MKASQVCEKLKKLISELFEDRAVVVEINGKLYPVKNIGSHRTTTGESYFVINL